MYFFWLIHELVDSLQSMDWIWTQMQKAAMKAFTNLPLIAPIFTFLSNNSSPQVQPSSILINERLHHYPIGQMNYWNHTVESWTVE